MRPNPAATNQEGHLIIRITRQIVPAAVIAAVLRHLFQGKDLDCRYSMGESCDTQTNKWPSGRRGDRPQGALLT
jgi:hypothetical protein